MEWDREIQDVMDYILSLEMRVEDLESEVDYLFEMDDEYIKILNVEFEK